MNTFMTKENFGFNKQVMRHMGKTFHSGYITMIKKGQRKNDEILRAIIEVDEIRYREREIEQVKENIKEWLPVNRNFKWTHGITKL